MKYLIKDILKYNTIHDLRKINNLTKYKNATNIGENNIKKLIKSFSLNKFKTYFVSYCTDFIDPIKKLTNCIDAVNKVLDGNMGTTVLNNFHYKTGFVDKIFNYSEVCGLRKINLYKKEKYGTVPSINFYNRGFCWYPLVSNDSFSYNSYVYSVYRYLYIKTNNSYISSFISLFYCYIGRLFSLFKIYKKNDINVIESNLSALISKLSSFVYIMNIGNVICYVPQFVSIKLINIINMSLMLSGKESYIYKPHLIGLTKYILTLNGVFAKLGFQETVKTLKNIIFEHKIDWKVDSKSNIILSDFIPVGSGWYRYFVN